MSLWSQARQDSAAFVATQPVADSAEPQPISSPTASPLLYHPVSPAEYTRLGDHDWLPSAMRGLEVAWPAEDWRIIAGDQVATSSAPPPPPRAQAPAAPICRVCDCPLFWDPVGQPGARFCVECSPPPSPRVVEDLWLTDSDDGWQRCVSKEPRWVKAALWRFEAAEKKRRETSAVQAARENEGF